MKCYLCGSDDYKLRDGEVRDNKELDICECNNCGLVFLSSTNHIDENYYEESNMSSDLNIQEWLNETCIDDSRRFEFLKEMILNRDIVDFGSGAGGYLLRAKEVAKSVTGIELDSKVATHYEENKINITASIDNLKDSSYDLISAFHVVEHLSQPREILEQLITKLKSGGKLIIEVPNSDDALLGIYKNKAFSKFTYWSPHLYLFNSKTLNMLLKPLDVRVDFTRYIQRYSLSNHMYWLSHNRPGGHHIWGNFIDSPELTRAYEAQLASIGATDTVIMQVTKI